MLDLIEAHVQKHCPPGATVTVRRFGGAARPFAITPDHPALAAAGEVLHELYGKEPYVTRAGGTLPVAETLQTALGADMVFFSWGMPNDNVHAPNESFLLDAFLASRRAYCLLLPELARVYAAK